MALQRITILIRPLLGDILSFDAYTHWELRDVEAALTHAHPEEYPYGRFRVFFTDPDEHSLSEGTVLGITHLPPPPPPIRSLHQDIRSHSYGECYDCGSVHTMEYCERSNSYECEECYQRIPYSQMEEILFNAYSFLYRIRTTDPHTAIRLITLYMRARHATDEEVYNTAQVREYYLDLCSDSMLSEKRLFRVYPCN